MTDLLQNLRHVGRYLGRYPGLACVVVVTLGLGSGASTAIFSLINDLVLSPYKFSGAGRVVRLRVAYADRSPQPPTLAEYRNWREETDVLTNFAAYASRRLNLGREAGAERVQATVTTPDLFSIVEAPILGRTFTADGVARGELDVVVLTEDLWRRRFEADPATVGQVVRLDGRNHTVIGVMPRASTLPRGTQLWIPMPVPAEDTLPDRFDVLARLRPGVSLAEARAAMNVRLGRYEDGYSAGPSPIGILISGIQADDLDYYGQTLLNILLVAVVFVLLIACANTALLLLAQGVDRVPELAVRVALGAGRSRIVRQLLTESFALALPGAAIGVVVAVYGVRWLKDAVPAAMHLERSVAGWRDVGVDVTALGFALALSVVTAMVFGLVPAWQAARVNPADFLGSAGWRRAGGGRQPVMTTLVVVEVALAVTLLGGATVLFNSFLLTLRADPGFDTFGVSTLELHAVGRPTRVSNAADTHGLLLDHVRGLPGVEAVGLITHLPLSRSMEGTRFAVAGVHGDDADLPLALLYRISPGYLDAMRIPLRSGRALDDSDARETPVVALISEAMADRYWPDGDALHSRMTLARTQTTVDVVGIVGTVHHNGVASVPLPQIYLPLPRSGGPASVVLVARSAGNHQVLTAAIREEVVRIAPDASLAEIRNMEQVEADFFAPERIMMVLLLVFAGIAFLVAMLGVHGIVAYVVANRAHEVGIRSAMGARPRQIVWLMIRTGMTATLLGGLVGVPAALAAANVLAGLVHGVRASHFFMLVVILSVLLIVVLVATVTAGRRVLRLDPVSALRASPAAR